VSSRMVQKAWMFFIACIVVALAMWSLIFVMWFLDWMI